MSNKDFCLKVSPQNSERDYPIRCKVTITPERAQQIRDMAELVKAGKHLGVWSVRVDDNSPIWLDGAKPEFADACHINVDGEHFWYTAYFWYTTYGTRGIEWATDSIEISELKTG
jgi:hypothetical protein